MTVYGFELLDRECSDSLNSWHLWGVWHVVIENEAGVGLVVDITGDDFFLTDNRDKSADSYVLMEDYNSCSANPFWGTGSVDVKLLEAGQELRIRAYGSQYIEDREWFEFGVREAGRIENARWRIEIPR